MGKLNINGGGVDTNKKMASIDERFGPYTSKEAADAALGGQGRNTITAGLTVGILTDNAGVKEYWYQPNKKSGVLELIPKGGNAADNPTEGNFASFDENGREVDSGCNEGTFIKGVQKNGTDLTPDADGKVNVEVQDGKSAYQLYADEYEEAHGGSTEGMLEEDEWLDSLDAYGVYVKQYDEQNPEDTEHQDPDFMNRGKWLEYIRGKSAREIYNQEKGTDYDDARFIEAIKANYPMKYVAYNENAYGETSPFDSIGSLDAGETTEGKLWFMPNSDNTETKLFITVNDGTAETPDYKWYNMGAVDIPKNALTEEMVDNECVDGATSKPASAKAVMDLKMKLRGIKFEEINFTDISDWHPAESTSGYFNNNKAWTPSEYFCTVRIPITGYDRVRFLGFNKDSTNNIAFGFLDNNNLPIGEFREYYDSTKPTENKCELIVEVNPDATYFVCLYKAWMSSYSAWKLFQQSDFYCYLEKGEVAPAVTQAVIGSNKKAVISQNALQSVLCETSELIKTNTIPRTFTNDGFYYDGVSSQYPNTPKYMSYMYKVNAGDILLIKTREAFGARIAFCKELTDTELNSLQTRAQGYVLSDKLIQFESNDYYKILEANSENIIVVPENCMYLVTLLYIQIGNKITYYNPVVSLTCIKDLLVKPFDEFFYSDYPINMGNLPSIDCFIRTSDYNWSSYTNYRSTYLKVIPGQSYIIKKDVNPTYSCIYAFLRSLPSNFDDISSENPEPADIVEFNNTKLFIFHEYAEIVIPKGCNYLYISLSRGFAQNLNAPSEISTHLYYIPNSKNENAVPFDYEDEYVRSSAVGLSDSNPIPLYDGTIYQCDSVGNLENKTLFLEEYFGTVSKVLVRMKYANTAANPTLSLNEGSPQGIIYNGAVADNTNSWFNGELCWLQYDGTNYILTSYDKTQITDTNSVAIKSTSKQQQNVLKLCNRYRFLKWSPRINGDYSGFHVGVPSHQHGDTDSFAWRETNEQEYGIPYSSVWQDQKYVGLNVSVYTFLTAVNNPYSLLYTETVTNNSQNRRSAWNRMYHSSNSSAYFGLVCCGFTAAVTGCMRNWNNTDIPKIANLGFEFVRISGRYRIKQDSIKVGDVFDSSGHSIVIYQLFQDIVTGKITHVRYAESTSVSGVRGCRFNLMTMEGFLSYMRTQAYSHYRYLKLYNNNLASSDVILNDNLDSDPKDITLNYNIVSTSYNGQGRLDTGDYDTAGQNQMDFNNEICTISGDKVTFPVGQYSIGNIIALNYNLDGNSLGNYDRIKVYKKGLNDSTYSLSNTYLLSDIDSSEFIQYLQQHTLLLDRPVDSQSVGEYYACLANSSSDSSQRTFWEIINNPCTITEDENGNVKVKWTNDIDSITMLYINDAQDPDPDPYFSGISGGNNTLISLSDSDKLNKEYIIDEKKFDGVDKSRVYLRLNTIGTYGITGVYVKLLQDGDLIF